VKDDTMTTQGLSRITCGVMLGCWITVAQAAPTARLSPDFLAQTSVAPVAQQDPLAASGAPSGTRRPAWSLYPPSRSFGVGLVDTYLLGAALGVLDYAGLHRLDHPVHRDTSGIWSIGKSPQFPAELIGLTLAGAVWEGGRSRFGKTLWQSLDAAAMAGISTQALKWTFQRTRPSSTTNPDLWFQGVHNMSFPSGDVSSITALVTPIILEYHRTDPGVDALAALPVFDMAARMKAHGHWLTDTMAGAAVGVASGYFAHRLHSPFILGLLPGGFYVGLHERF
jgi:undecaprenyl-diphosphatase